MFTIEEDSGTSTGTSHRHNGYYAGDFGRLGDSVPSRTSACEPQGAQS